MRAAGQFGEMAAALERNDAARTRLVAAGLIQDFPASPYADQAQLTLARMAVDEGKPADAVGPLTRVMNGSKDDELKHIARLRLARVQIDQGKPDDAIKTLAEDKPGTFVARYHEVRGDAFYAKNDLKSAAAEYKAALEGADTGGVNPALVQMKIADLGAAPAASPSAAPASSISAAPTPAPATANKAKP